MVSPSLEVSNLPVITSTNTRTKEILSLCQAEGRGVKDPERLKRQQKRKEDAEKEALKQGPSDGGLKVHYYIVQI